MGNQQERLEKDWHWLGGIIDGEGSINLLCARRGKTWQLLPFCNVVNTSETMMEEIKRIFAEAEIPHHVMKLVPTKGTKEVTRFTMSGAKRSKKFLLAVMPYLRSKRQEAEILLSWIDSRLSKPKNTPYDKQEVDWYMDLRRIHGRRTPVSPETIRQELLRQIAA